MRIFYDYTEARVDSKLPKNVLNAGTELIGLERETGADLIISPLNEPDIKKVNIPGLRALRKHTEAGVLIQRKSGSDLLSSIPKLNEIEMRMQEWGLAWLLVTGVICRNHYNKCMINDYTSEYEYEAVIGALDAWQLRGGGLTVLQWDGQIEKWAQLMGEKICDTWDNKEKVVFHREPRQLLVPPSAKDIDNDTVAAVQTLVTFPGIGVKTAQSIAQHCGGKLWASLCYLSDPSSKGVKGVGKGTLEKARRWLGLDWERQKLEVVQDDPTESIYT